MYVQKLWKINETCLVDSKNCNVIFKVLNGKWWVRDALKKCQNGVGKELWKDSVTFE